MRGLFIALALSAPAYADAAPEAGTSETADLETAAKAWLAEVDAGKYGQAWIHADLLLQGAVTKTTFAQGVQIAREPLGSEQSRTLAATSSATSLPGAPDGVYATLTYHTRFAQRPRP